MCGIAGVFSLNGEAVPETIVRTMVHTLRHRGPDGKGSYVEGPIGLGHQRLKVIDLSEAASQPMGNEDGSMWIVFNGEIYNFMELRRDLEARGCQFRSNSDTEVLLYLYEEYGDDCVQRLDGMFAFAIWHRSRQRLFLARDRAGKKPLYYGCFGTRFIFASEVKAILCHPDVSGELSTKAMPQYFRFGYPSQGTTFYRDIAELLPAHTLVVDAQSGIRTHRYWDLEFSSSQEKRSSSPEIAERVRGLVTEGVRKRLVSDVPLGAFLSGGIDSSIVVGIMSHLLDRPVKTFSIGFTGDASMDEAAYARTVAHHFGTDHQEFIVEPKAVNLVDDLVWNYDGPFGDASAIPTSILAQLTRQHVTVALNGDGGDELFAGYLRFRAGLMAANVPRPLARFCDHLLSAVPEPKQYHHWLRRAKRFFRVAAYPASTHLRGWVSIFEEDLGRLLRAEVWEDLGGGEPDYPDELMKRTARYSLLSKLLYINFMTYLPQDVLIKTDRCTMGHSLEGRSPFLDYRLVEYVATLPDRYKLRGNTSKYILRKAFADMVPGPILRRGKRGFGVPLGSWFRSDLKEYLCDHLLAATALSREYLEGRYVASLVKEHLDGVRDHGLRLWSLLTFEVWLRQVRRGKWQLSAASS